MIVELLTTFGDPFPLSNVTGGSGLCVNLRLTIDGAVADNGATYGPATIGFGPMP